MATRSKRPRSADAAAANKTPPKVLRSEATPNAGAGAGAGAGAAATTRTVEEMTTERIDALTAYKASIQECEAMIPIIGRMYRKQNIVVIMYGHSLTNKSPLGIYKQHKYASTFFSTAVRVHSSLLILKAAERVNLKPMKLDVGRAAVIFKDIVSSEGDDEEIIRQLVTAMAVKAATTKSGTEQISTSAKPRDIVLYGFGRIGRLVARVLIEKTGGGSKFVLRAIVVRPKPVDDIKKRVNLMLQDSVHGPFNGIIEYDLEKKTITCNGNVIQLIYAKQPDQIDYTKYGISDAVVIDNTGIWRNEEGLGQHLKCPGVKQVLLTAPGKGVTTIVAGVNNDRVSPDVNIYAAASCTTNAIVPILKCLNDKYGIESGHLETVHAFTNDQNLIDNYHKKARRGRSAALNMVLTETGAAKAVAQSLPEMAGKLSGSAIRVPTPNVSMAVLILQLGEEVTKEDLNNFLFNEATYGRFYHQIGFSKSEDAVSTDFVGARSTGVIDAPATICKGKRCNLYVWYDNEFGYACQVIRLLQQITGVVFHTFPPMRITS